MRSPSGPRRSPGPSTWTTTRSCCCTPAALLASSPQGATAYVQADLRDTGTILAEAAGVLDFGRPVAVMLLGVLHCIPDQDGPAAIVARLMAAVPAGSYLAIAHPASDVATEQMPIHGRVQQAGGRPGHRSQLR